MLHSVSHKWYVCETNVERCQWNLKNIISELWNKKINLSGSHQKLRNCVSK